MVWVVVCLFPGCSLLNISQLFVGEESVDANHPETTLLKKMPVPPEVIVLEVVLIERPNHDPLLGETLWDELDEIASVDYETRQTLKRNGLRVGRSGANPPRALQTLLGDSPEIGTHDDGENRLSGQCVMVPSGGESRVTASEVRMLRNVLIVGENEDRTETLENARCVFRIQPHRLQDGWARIEFLPELHHGEFTNRRTATEEGWQWDTSQKIEKLYRQQFAVDLNVGEMVILTSTEGPEFDLGDNFFRGSGESKHLQRLLVVRLAELNRMEQVFDQ
ncbi:hypothetical protein [Thalassoroseus pseudoceratinae]|uniref:hypothetical protein n=1 Tax=Thalassoroseus pseudoceratinae TaxID=2713176 RepID=UPI001421A0D8|nr:hypothetical protein [Thalassoroseus pseudoceratinae]